MACLMNLVCFKLAECDEIRWRRKLCYGNVMEKIWQVAYLSYRETHFCSEQTQQIKQEQMIYVIILTDLNEEDKNIKEIMEEKNTWNKSNMLQLF
jgi:hypothetical protein